MHFFPLWFFKVQFRIVSMDANFISVDRVVSVSIFTLPNSVMLYDVCNNV